MSLFNSMNEFLARMWFLPHVCQYEPLLHVGCSTLFYLSHPMEYFDVVDKKMLAILIKILTVATQKP